MHTLTAAPSRGGRTPLVGSAFVAIVEFLSGANIEAAYHARELIRVADENLYAATSSAP